MIKPSVSVIMDWPKIRELTAAQITALEQTTEALHTEIVQAQVIPRDQGHLQNDSTYPDLTESAHGKTSIISNRPYARRLYFHPEYKFHREPWTDNKGKRHEGNPHAKGKWFDDWISGSQRNFVKNTFQKLYKEISGL